MQDLGGGRMNVDKSWFEKNRRHYLDSGSFRHFSELSGVDLADLATDDPERKREAQQRLAAQSIILNEIRKEHAGFGFPLFVYTHFRELFEPVPRLNLEIDKTILQRDMTDSLRRRHIALSHAILPDVFSDASRRLGTRLTVHNLGSGAGLDVLHALRHRNDCVASVLNVDLNESALNLGRCLCASLAETGDIPPETVQFEFQNLTAPVGACDVAVLIGVICGLPDRTALALLRRVWKSLRPGGALVISCANVHMRSVDPLASFLIQNIGTRGCPHRGWVLNYRTSFDLMRLLRAAGFARIELYDDANFPGRDGLPPETLKSVDTLPASVYSTKAHRRPLALPSSPILERRLGYNWLAVARKSAASTR